MNNVLKNRKSIKLKEIIIGEIGGDWGQEKEGENSFLRCYVLRGTDFQNAQNGILEGIPIRYIKSNSFKRRKLEANDILIELSGGSKDQPTGRIFIARDKFLRICEGNVLFSNFVKKLKIDMSRCFPEYFFRYWQFLYKLGKTRTYEKRTTGIRNFKYKEFLNNELILLPSISEQKKIVYVLDSIQEAVGVQDKIIEKTKELKRSLMHKLFREGTRGAKLKKTEIGEIPENWEVVRLGEVVNIFDNKRIPLSEEQRQKMKGDYPYCGANGIIDYINNYIFDGEYILLAEDGGDWGKFGNSSYIMHGRFWVNNHAHILQAIKGKTINYFLSSILNFLDLTGYISGTTRGKLNQGTMRNIISPFPPLSEQREIAEILQTIDQKIEIEKRKKELYEELFKSMLNQLMTGNIRVKDINFGK